MDKTNLNNGHWQAEDYTQRMTNAEWQNILLGSCDRIVVQGCYRQLIVKKSEYGVVEIGKKPMEGKL